MHSEQKDHVPSSGSPTQTVGAGPRFTVAERDAYATIRGYVYQAERTVLAWLDLAENEILLCEAGEDIDWVRVPEDDGPLSPERLLEQVKHREKALSLRSPSVVEALGNYLSAVEENPGWRLTFRLFTNASSAREEHTRFPRDLTGIEAWQRAAAGELTADEMGTFVARLRKVLANPPASARGRAATRVTQFLAGADDEQIVETLVRPVDWALRQPAAEALQPLIEQRLRERGVDTALYPRLLLQVLRQLSSGGPKRFDQSGLKTLLASGAMHDDERAFFETIRTLLTRADSALTEIASGVRTVLGQQAVADERLSAIQAVLHDIAAPESQLGLQVSSDEPPPAPALFATRPDRRRRSGRIARALDG